MGSSGVGHVSPEPCMEGRAVDGHRDGAMAAFESFIYAKQLSKFDLAQEVRQVLCFNPTTSIGIYDNYDFTSVTGGMDFRETFRFKKELFTVLLEVLDKIPDGAPILLLVNQSPLAEESDAKYTITL